MTAQIESFQAMHAIKLGPFKCYVMQMGECQIFRKKRYECARFNVISVTRGWVGVQFPEKKRYLTLEWPHTGMSAVFFRKSQT